MGDVYVIVATDKNRKLYSGETPIIPENQRFRLHSALLTFTQETNDNPARAFVDKHQY